MIGCCCRSGKVALADAFINYQHEQREQAGRGAELLRASAYGVGWDRKLGSGDDFQLTISKKLEAAARVVVL